MTKTLTADQLAKLEAPLEDILRACGGQIWHPDAIAAHKAHELTKAPPASRLWPYRKLLTKTNRLVFAISGNIFALFLPFSLLVAAFAVFSFIAYWDMGDRLPIAKTVSWHAAILAVICFGIWAVCFLICLGSYFLRTVTFRGPAEWKAIPCHQFFLSNGVPLEVCNLVTDVERIRPGRTWTAHALLQDKHLLDPILEVDGIFCKVWDQDGKVVLPSN